MLMSKSERHITRHRQKDEEAGAEGCGILNTRKVSLSRIMHTDIYTD
jgi:hypothetical protein